MTHYANVTILPIWKECPYAVIQVFFLPPGTGAAVPQPYLLPLAAACSAKCPGLAPHTFLPPLPFPWQPLWALGWDGIC